MVDESMQHVASRPSNQTLNSSHLSRRESRDNSVNLRGESRSTSVTPCVAVLRILVLTMDRHESLLRLLKSLKSADYDGDCVDVDIWIDRMHDGSVHGPTHQIAKTLQWPFGQKVVHVHEENVGLRGIFASRHVL